MKRLIKFSIVCFIIVMLSTCGKNESPDDDGIQIVEWEPIEAPGSAESGPAADPFTGEYNDYDTNEPNLEIRKNEDETYQIYIDIFRLASFDDAVGMLTETGLAFTATAPDLSEAAGVITLEGDIATVTFDPGWNGFEGVFSYKYYKTSDTPNFNL